MKSYYDKEGACHEEHEVGCCGAEIMVQRFARSRACSFTYLLDALQPLAALNRNVRGRVRVLLHKIAVLGPLYEEERGSGRKAADTKGG